MKTSVISTLTCCVCTTPLTDENRPKRLERALICFVCDFWIDKWHHRDDPRSIRIDGHHYMVGPESVVYKAFDGQRFAIELNDGIFIFTSNLWHQGRIPERFRDLLPDNAKSKKEIK